jgi:peptidoglycan hydrolase-like protein with peptidoglycan-binding domain
MNPNGRTTWTRVVFTILMTGILGLSLMPRASAQSSSDVKKVQETLRDKGYYTAPVDGVMGPQTRAAISKYQEAEKLPVTGRLDSETAGKLGVGAESAGSSFKGAGQAIGTGGKEAGHAIVQGKPIEAAKEMGKGLGEGGKGIGKGVTQQGKVVGNGLTQEGKTVGKGLGQGGKEAGKGLSQGGKDVGQGVRKAATPGTGNGDEKK